MQAQPKPITVTAAISAMLWAVGATAQVLPSPPPDAGRLLEQTRPPPRPAPPVNQPPRRLIDTPTRPTVEMPEGVAVVPSGFRISGAVSFPESVLAELVKPWVGRKLDLAGLNEAAGAITRHYQAGGQFLSYAYLPAQKVADGVIEIAVLEGRIEASQVANAPDVRLRDELVQAHIAPLVDAKPVLQADVERQLLLLNDIPGVVARAAFTPGASPGAAEIVVSVAEDEPLGVDFGLDNHGSVSSGEYRAGFGLQFRDLFGWGDETQARLIASNQGRLVSGNLGFWVPMGGGGVKIGALLSSLSYELGAAFAAVGATGSAQSMMLRARYPIVRTQNANLDFEGDAERKRLRDEVQLVGSINPRSSSLLKGTLAFDLRDGLGGGGVTAGSLGVAVGVLRFLNDSAANLDAATLQTAGDYKKAGLTLTRQQQLLGPLSAYLRYSGQFAHRNLDSSEKLALGGAGAVRAYAPGEAVVDDGRIGTLELRLAQDYLGGALSWSLFYDRGWGRINVNPPAAAVATNEPRLSGTGLGLQWNAGDFGLAASLAWRGSRVPTAEGGDPTPRLYFQLFYLP
jgi:hemolysin activation/secretion protein